jgi:hypothetical protein
MVHLDEPVVVVVELRPLQAARLFLVRSLAAWFREHTAGNDVGVIVAASTVAIVAIAAVVIVALVALIYIVPRGGRRRR